jgi:hypothetical protein
MSIAEVPPSGRLIATSVPAVKAVAGSPLPAAG